MEGVVKGTSNTQAQVATKEEGAKKKEVEVHEKSLEKKNLIISINDKTCHIAKKGHHI